jgi:hypothetical protein
MAVNNDPEWLDAMRPLQNTGRSKLRRHGVHKRRSHKPREKAAGPPLTVQTHVDCLRRRKPLIQA